MSTPKYPPYVNAYGNISKLFDEIKKASVPPKFTLNFLTTMLGLKSSSYRAMIPLLKRLGFIDQGNVPTKEYKSYRDDDFSGKVMAKSIKKSYEDLYTSNEYAHKLSKPKLSSKLKTITGASADSKVIPSVVGTFLELVKLANFKSDPSSKVEGLIETQVPTNESQNSDKVSHSMPKNLGISYTINLNLPATTEVEVFNVIFKSLKEHILNE